MPSILQDILAWLRMRPRLFGQAVSLTPKQKELAEKFKRGIAEVLGVPPEAIRDDVVAKWVTEWSRAFVKEEYWHLLEP